MSDTDETEDQATKETLEGEREQAQEDVETLRAKLEEWKRAARKWEQRAKTNEEAARRLAEAEEAEKTVAEKLADAQRRAQEAELGLLRYQVATEKNLPPKLARFLHGSSREEIEEAAAELLEAIRPADTGGSPDTGTTRRPRERLRPGAAPDAHPQPTKDELLRAIGRL
jgi:hypothetical protein